MVIGRKLPFVVARALLLFFRINVNDARLGVESSSGCAMLGLLSRMAKLTNHKRDSKGENHGHHHSKHEDHSVRQTIPRISIAL